MPGWRWWQPAGAGRPSSCETARTASWSIPFDTTTFAEALDQLLADDDRRRSVAAAGRPRVQEFAWPAVAERYRAVYASVVPADPAGHVVDDRLSRPRGESVS